MKKINLIIKVLHISLLITACQKIEQDYHSNIDEYYEWAKPVNLDKPSPNIYEFKFGLKKYENQRTVFRIEKEFVSLTSNIVNAPIYLCIPIKVLNGELSAKQYIKEYESYDYHRKNRCIQFAIGNNSAVQEKMTNLSSLEKNKLIQQYKNEHRVVDVNDFGDKCEIQLDKNKQFYFCDLFDKNTGQLKGKYYWTANPKNIDLVTQQAIMFDCNIEPNDKFCASMSNYDERVSLIKGGMSMENSHYPENNPFVYVNYMPQIIKFLNDRKVK